MPNRARDWLAQSRRDLEQAIASRDDGRHEWACFAAHQAAEKSRQRCSSPSRSGRWGHVIARLFRELPVSVPPDLIEKGRSLDNFYVPTRYPNGHPAGAPFEHYGPLQSEPGYRLCP